MIYKSQCEYDLSCRAEYHQPERNVVITEETLEIYGGILEKQQHRYYWRGQQHRLQKQPETLPDTFGVQIPQIYIIGNELSEYYGKIIAENTIDEHEVGSDNTQYPVCRR